MKFTNEGRCTPTKDYETGEEMRVRVMFEKDR